MKVLKFLSGFVLIFIFNSCAYYPQLTDIPLINKKGDVRIDAGVTSMLSANATASYGLNDKLALQVYGNIVHGYYFQAAAGPYKNLKNGNVLELYNGLGYGYGDAYNDANPGNLKGNYQILFSQLNFGHRNGSFAHSDYGVSLKAGYMHSYMKDDNYYDIYSYEPFRAINYIRDHSLLLEPTAFWRFGGERLKISFKVGSSYICKFTNRDKYFPYSNLNFGIGLNYGL